MVQLILYGATPPIKDNDALPLQESIRRCSSTGLCGDGFSAASRSDPGFEEDASTRDGVHNTRALYRSLREHCYGFGDDLYLLSWTGHHHDSRSWAARVSTPLQLFFPRGA